MSKHDIFIKQKIFPSFAKLTSDPSSKTENGHQKKYIDPRYQKLRFDAEGKYSISHPKDAEFISEIVKDQLIRLGKKKNQSIIIDATAGIGGNVLSFAQNFGQVIAIEIDSSRFKLLQNNIGIYELTNIVSINKNFLDVIYNLQGDVIFIDPPWGGKDYKLRDFIRITLSGLTLESICNTIFEKTKIKCIVLKLPKNYDMKFLHSQIDAIISTYHTKKLKILTIQKDMFQTQKSNANNKIKLLD